MATEPSPQRAYRAACPNCGAPVDFRSAASASAVCSFCRSTLVRDGDALRRIGESAELFDDHSPLQLGASGKLQGVAFTLVGRLQYSTADGTWNEWHALFDVGGGDVGTPPRSAWLSEDNGAYVIAFDRLPQGTLPAPAELRAGSRVTVDGGAWDVASVVQARLLAAQGELPRPPKLQGEFTVIDLRNVQGEVGTLDYAEPQNPQWSIGRSITLTELAMQGLREVSEKTLASRALACPSCGASLEVKLATTQSITCGQCHAVVDLAGPDGQGVGADLAHYAQANSGESGIGPQIPLGSTGHFAFGATDELPWQVVGYLERCDLPEADSEDEQTFWREYLLYNQTAGFAFLVDAEDGWSRVRPITGAPSGRGDTVEWQGIRYSETYAYAAKVTWVQGEFYWRVRREERAQVTDYEGDGAGSGRRLSREAVGQEVTWSAGETMDAALVADAFRLPPSARPAIQRDAAPASMANVGASLGGFSKMVIVFIMLVVMMILLSRCDGDDCDSMRQTFGASSNEYQQCVRNRGTGGSYGTSGGSWGGYSSGGGGHK